MRREIQQHLQVSKIIDVPFGAVKLGRTVTSVTPARRRESRVISRSGLPATGRRERGEVMVSGARLLE